MSASEPKESSDEESEESVSIEPCFLRHKNSIIDSTIPVLRLRHGRLKSPRPTSFDLILEDEPDESSGPSGHDEGAMSTPIPDLLCEIPSPKILSMMGSNLKGKRKKSVHFKVPVWEQINDEEDIIPVLEKCRRPKKMKGVIKHFCPSTIILQQVELDPVPKYAQVSDAGDSLFTNSQLLRLKLKWRRIRDKCIFTFMIFVAVLFMFPIIRLIVT